jgi:hypothetical protein
VASSSSEIISSRSTSRASAHDAIGPDSFAKLTHELVADIPADIGLDQQHLEIFEKFFIDVGPVKESGDFAENATARFLQTLFQLHIGFRLPAKHAA